MNEPASPYAVTNQNCPAFWLNDNLWMPLAGSSRTDGNVCFIEQVFGEGSGGLCAHSHPYDEGVYILEGQFTFNVGGKTFKAGPSTFISIPRLVEHSYSVDVPRSKLLNWFTPGGFEMLLMGLGTPATERKLPAPNSIPLPPRWMVEECSREFGQIAVHGLPFADKPTKDNMATKASEVTPVKPYYVESKNAPAYWTMGDLWTILATKEQTGGSYSIMEELCSINSGPGPHTHEQDEVFYVIEGQVTLIAGPLTINAKAGSFAYIPAHCIHTFRVDVDKTRFLNLYFPGGFEKIITEYGVPAKALTLPPKDLKVPQTPEQLKALNQRVGLTMVDLPDVLRKPK